MDSLFFDYIKNSHGNDNLDINFSIKRVPLCMANAIRRILISDIPIVAFNDTWDDRPEFRSINIMKNTSGIHNEFLSHRLSLTPICMYKNDLLKIQTKFVKKRQFTFNKKKVPIFKINIKNNQETRSKLKISGSMTITSENIEYLDDSDEYPDIRTFFQPNSISNDFIIIDLLKPDIINDNESEELDLIMKPNIGFGHIKANYSPVCIPSFEFLVDESKVESIFNDKIIFKNKERVKKGLKEYSEEVIEKLKKSYHLLDKQRVFLRDINNNPNMFKFRIESIGFLESDQLVYDALIILELKLIDIINSIIVDLSNNIKYTNHINLDKSYDDLLGYIFTIKDEDHTIGNLISEYMKLLYASANPIDCNIITFVSYRMPHPLNKSIEIKMKLNSNLTESAYKQIHDAAIIHFLPDIDLLTTSYDSEYIQMNLITFILIKTLSHIISDINVLKHNWSSITPNHITTPSFLILDNDEYIGKYRDIGNQFNIKDIYSTLIGQGISNTQATLNIPILD